MSAVEVHSPLALRLVGTPTEDDWQRLEDALAKRYERAFRQPVAPHRALLGGARADSAYGPAGDGRRRVPSYDDDGAPAAVDVRDAAALAREQLDAAVPASSDPAVRRGIYTTIDGELRLWFLDEATQSFLPLWIYSEHGDARATMKLVPGRYSFVARPRSDAWIYRGSRLFTRVRNPNDVDMTVDFVVPQEPGTYATTVTATRYRFYPRLRVQRIDGEPQVATGAQSVFLANVEIWRHEDDGSAAPLFGLALVYAFVSYEWQVWKLGKAPAPNAERPRRLVHSESGRRAFLRYVWKDDGDYEVKCTVAVNYDEASPTPVTDGARVDVVALEFKMALQLASLEKAQQQPGAAPVWGGSTLVIYDLLYRALRREREAAEPNQARIDYLTEQIEKLNRHVQSASDGPWPIHAIFTEPRTSKTMPLQLFVGPAHERDAGRAHTWVLVDLTYPAFYRTYRGSGETVREAIVACFEDARTSFRHTYPPGRILARIEFTGMERHGVAAGWDYSIETESWQRTAYEWLSLGASAIGAIGLAALIVFPPSAVLTGVIVVGAVAGATVSAINIAERIHTDAFEWDMETFVDIAQIAAAFAFGAGAVARGAASRIVSAIPRGQTISIAAASKLGQLVKFQRGMLFIGVGSDVVSGVLLSVDTYDQLRNIDVAIGPEALRDYQRLYGSEEGRKRWETERVTRIMGILARAAVGLGMTVISVRSTVHDLRASAPAVPDYTGLPPDEAALLRQTEGLGKTTIADSQVDAELAIVKRTPKRLTNEDGYVEEVVLPNGHTWRRRQDGTWCRFSRDPFCLLPNAQRVTPQGTDKPLRQLAIEAGALDEIEHGRIAVFLHGASEGKALALVDDPKAVLSAVGGNHDGRFFATTNWATADEFAARAVSGPAGGRSAIVALVLPQELLERLRRIRVRDPHSGREVPAVYTRPIHDRPGMIETIFDPSVLRNLVNDGYFFLVR